MFLTSAYDLGDEEPYKDVMINEWFDKDGLFIKYLDKKMLNYSAIRRNILEINPDKLYLNSLFSQKFTLFPLLVARRSRHQGCFGSKRNARTGCTGDRKR